MYLQNNFTEKEHLFFLNYFFMSDSIKSPQQLIKLYKEKRQIVLLLHIPTDLNLNFPAVLHDLSKVVLNK